MGSQDSLPPGQDPGFEAPAEPGTAQTVFVVACAFVLLNAAAPARATITSRSDSRAVVAFLPAGGENDPGEIVDRLARHRQLAVGLMSMTQGRYRPVQAYLDMTSGTRTSAAAYSPEHVPLLEFVQGGDGRGFIFNWRKATDRAKSAPAEIHLGLLASAIPGGAAYVGLTSRPNVEGVVAADRDGWIASASIGRTSDQAARVRRALTQRRFVVAGLATGFKGDHVLDQLLRDRRPQDLLFVVQTPPVSRALQLLPVGVAGLGGRGAVTSDTTHLKGIVAGIDVPSTVLMVLHINRPSDVKGEQIYTNGPRNLRSLHRLQERLEVVGGRRTPTLLALLFSWAAVILVLGLIADQRGVRTGMRIGGLGVLWILPLLLLAGAVAPSRVGEFAIVVGGSMLFGAITDRIVPWPHAPVVPAAATLLAYAIDLAAGSPLIIRSLLGVSPRSGSRFYGVGNELEAVLSVTVLLGVGAMLTHRKRSARSAGLFAGAGMVLAAIVGSGHLGADVGGMLTVGSSTAVATLLMLPGDVTRLRVLLAVLAPAGALVALAVLDLATGGNGHFTRTVLHAQGGQALWDIVRRRYTLAYNVLSTGVMPFITLLALLGGAYALRYRDRVYGPLCTSDAWRAAMIGAFVGVILGSLTNDSGPILLIFGSFVLAAATAYVRGNPSAAPQEGFVCVSGPPNSQSRTNASRI